MKANQRAPLSLAGSTRQGFDFDDRSMMTELTKKSTASAPPAFPKSLASHHTSSKSSMGKRQSKERRRASTSFIKEFPDLEDVFSGDSVEAGWKNIDGDFRISTTGKNKERRRSSALATTPLNKSSFDGDAFAGFAPIHQSQRRHSAIECSSCDFRDNAFTHFAGNTKSTEAPFSKTDGADPDDFSGELFFPGQSPIANTENGVLRETSLHPPLDTDRKTNKRLTKENPLLLVPDPLAELRKQQEEEQQAEDDFFANLSSRKKDKDFFAEASFNASGCFLEEGFVVEDDFSDEGTILWEEGGVIVPKSEKYNGDRSNGSLSSNFSFLHSSTGDLKTEGNAHKASRHPCTVRKRLDGLEVRHNRRSVDDDLTTATPSTRLSTDSEYSSSTSRSRRSTPAPGVELKTGSLLSDLVLIMDGKMEIPGGKKGASAGLDKSGSTLPSKPVAAEGGINERRPPRRRSIRGDTDDDAFVVRQEIRGENMRSFSKVSRSKSSDGFERIRRPPGRSRSSKSSD